MNKLILVLIAVLAAGAVCSERLCGLERMLRLDRLPELLEGAQAMQVSSHDRLGGNRGDGYYATHPCLDTGESGEKVLFDELAPGCLYRFWMTFQDTFMLTNRVKFYFDGETIPRVDLTIEELFCGTNAPFLTPLVGDAAASCMGYYCYLPFEYETGLKVTMDWVPTGTGYNSSPFYYNMTFHRFDSAAGVQTWDGSEAVALAVDMLSQLGCDPKPTNGNVRVSAVANVAAGTVVDLLDLTSVGSVQSIRLDPFPATVSVLQNCRLLMNWDGGTCEVDVPLGSFFGSGTNEMEVSSLPLGMSTNGDYYCFFPMPFWESAEICISNSAGASVEIPYEIQYSTNQYDPLRCGYFHAVYTNQTVGDDGRDVPFLTTQGRGHFAGLSLYIVGTGRKNALDYLEGDERIYFEGSPSPAIYGTGTEDYFNCAWYFGNAPCLLPYHGCVLQERDVAKKEDGTYSPNATQTYRFHLSDVLPFYSEFKFGMEHGRENEISGTYASVAYFYKQPNDGWLQTGDFDVLDGAAVSYQTEGGSVVSNSWCFEGDDDQIFVSAEGMSFTGASEFRVPVSTNAGVVLRRLVDRGPGRQKASVCVDGAFAGTWYDADCNFLKARKWNQDIYEDVNQRWNQSEFLLPRGLTAGKTNLLIRIERDADGADEWNEYRYEVYCLAPLDHPTDVDRDGLPDSWEVAYFNSVSTAVPDGDEDADGMNAWGEYIAGTSPVDAASVFKLRGQDGQFDFFARSNRTYHVWFATNLVGGAWRNVTNFPGAGLVSSLHSEGARGFYRVDVEKDE